MSATLNSYETITISDDSTGVATNESLIPFALQLDSGRIIEASEFTREEFEESGGAENLACPVCLAACTEIEDAKLGFPDRVERTKNFVHQTPATHTSKHLRHMHTVVYLSQEVAAKGLKVDNGYQHGRGPDITVEGHGVKVAVEVQNPQSVKNNLRDRNKDFKSQGLFDQWLYPPDTTPELFMKDGNRNLVVYADIGSPVIKLGVFSYEVVVENLANGSQRKVHLPASTANKTMKAYADESVSFSASRLVGLLTPLEQWMFGQTGFVPSWGTAAFDVDEFFSSEEDRLASFVEEAKKTPKKSKVDAVKAFPKAQNASSRPRNAMGGFSEGKTIPAPEIDPDDLQWFLTQYFSYRHALDKKVSLHLAKSMDLQKLSGTLAVKDLDHTESLLDADDNIADSVDRLNTGIFWNFIPSKKGWSYYVDPRWLGIIGDVVSVHRRGVTQEELPRVPYAGKKDLDSIRSHSIEFRITQLGG